MPQFKFFSNTPTKSITHVVIPDDHFVINVGSIMYSPITFYTTKIVYYKHINPNMERVYKMYIGEGHPLWNWRNTL